MRGTAWIAIGVILAADALAFAGIAWNQGRSTAALTLTERELRAGFAGPESTAVNLDLRWQPADPEGLLDREALDRLGFDTGKDPAAEDARLWYERRLRRQVYVVLEYAGGAWRRALAEKRQEVAELERKAADGEATEQDVERAREELEDFRGGHSRLFAVAVGTDPDELRRRYQEPGRHLILRAAVEIDHQPAALTGEDEGPRIRGRIRAIRPETLHVPHAHREPVLATLEGRRPAGLARWMYGRPRPEGGPRYRVAVHNGRRYVPWVTRVTAGGEPAPPEPVADPAGRE